MLHRKVKIQITLAFAGILLGSLGVLASKSKSFAYIASLVSVKQTQGTLASACIPSKQQDEIYFVSCGGTF